MSRGRFRAVQIIGMLRETEASQKNDVIMKLLYLLSTHSFLHQINLTCLYSSALFIDS